MQHVLLMATLFVTVTAASGFAAGWSIGYPMEGQNYGSGATISAMGSGENNESFILELRNNAGTTIENSVSGTVVNDDWVKDLPPPSGGWTVENNKPLRLVSGGVLKHFIRVDIQ